MFERTLEAVRREASGTRALDDIVSLTRFHRIQASPGYDAAAEWLEASLVAAGLAPERTLAPADGLTRYGGYPMPEGWRCRHAHATLHGARGDELLADFAAAPLSIVQRSDRARGCFPLVVLPSLDALAHTDVRAKAVLVSGPVQRAHERAVVARGAAGLVLDGRRLLPPVRTDEHDRDSLAYTSFWWLGDRPRGWGVVVSPARGQALRERLAGGEALAVEIDFDCERYVGDIPLVSAAIPGTLPGEVLLTSHLCHPQPGANDNASGAAATLECARVLAALAAKGDLPEPRRTLRFLWMPEFTGTFAWQALHPERAARTVAALNLDMVGERQEDCGSTLLLEQAPHFMGSFADELLARILSAAQAWERDAAEAGRSVLARLADVPYSGGSDHALWLDPAFGVPCPMLIQWPDRYYHSDLDTPERCDPDSLALAVRAAATYAAFVAGAGANEADWLLQLVARGAHRRLLAALDRPDPWEAVHAERERGQLALASVERLTIGLRPEHAVRRAIAASLPLAADQLEGDWDREIRDAVARPLPAPSPERSRTPVRAAWGLVCPIRWLAPGWDDLGEDRQTRVLSLEAEIPGGSTAIDVAWFACDGERDVGEIARRVVREGWNVDRSALEEWFELAVALGLCTWRERSGTSDVSERC